MTSTQTSPTMVNSPTVPLPVTRMRVGRILMSSAAVGALASALGSVGVIAAATPQMQMVETWRGYGYLIFAGLFTLLAWRPMAYRGVWELVLLHKLALTATAIAYAAAGSAEGTGTVIVWDGALSAVVGVAYFACRGWTAGTRLQVSN